LRLRGEPLIEPRPNAGNVPGQQFAHAVHGMAGDPFKDVAKIRLRIEPMQLRRFDKAVDCRRALPTGV
jgi:hypothetical protein